jgi:predicted chitinase
MITQTGSGASASALGAAAVEVGRSIQQVGTEITNKATTALNTAVYTDKISKATLEFEKRLNDRLLKTVDENGNPNFDTLVTDIGEIGRNVQDEIGATIFNSDVKSEFNNSLTKYTTNKQILGFSQQRTLALDYMKNSLSSGLDNLVTSAIGDDASNNQFYFDKIDKILTSAVGSGFLTSDQVNKARSAATEKILVGQYSALIEASPSQALELLKSATAAELGVSDDVKDDLLVQADVAKKSSQLEGAQKEHKESGETAANNAAAEAELRNGIKTGQHTEADIARAFLQKRITSGQAAKLFKEKKELTLADINTQIIKDQINVALIDGRSLVDVATPAQIDNHYKEAVTRVTPEGMVPSMETMAKIAAVYKFPLSSMKKAIESATKSGSDEEAAEALKAFEYLQIQNPIAVDGLSAQTLAALSLAKTLSANTMLSDTAAMKQARATVFIDDDKVKESRAANFNKEDAFKSDKINSTILSMLGGSGIFGFGDKYISAQDNVIIGDMLKSAYVLSGDVDGAKEMVKAQLAATFGESKLNATKGFLDDTEQLMFFPPDKVFPEINPDDMRLDLENDVKSLLPEGIDPASVFVASDQLTVQSGVPVTYGVYYLDKFGVEVPVTDANGAVKRWAPSDSLFEAAEIKAAAAKQEAIQSAQGAIEKANSFDQILKDLEADVKDSELLKGIRKSRDISAQKADQGSKSALPNSNPRLGEIAKNMAGKQQKLFTNVINNQQTLSEFGINTSLRLRHFLAQIAHESDNFNTLEEYASGAQYEGRKDLGNAQKGDGVKYKGRGYIQLTGRDNYRRYGRILGVDLENNPELASDPAIALKIAAEFWRGNGLNELADKNDIRAITKKINGGLNGLDSRIRFLTKTFKDV